MNRRSDLRRQSWKSTSSRQSLNRNGSILGDDTDVDFEHRDPTWYTMLERPSMNFHQDFPTEFERRPSDMGHVRIEQRQSTVTLNDDESSIRQVSLESFESLSNLSLPSGKNLFGNRAPKKPTSITIEKTVSFRAEVVDGENSNTSSSSSVFKLSKGENTNSFFKRPSRSPKRLLKKLKSSEMGLYKNAIVPTSPRFPETEHFSADNSFSDGNDKPKSLFKRQKLSNTGLYRKVLVPTPSKFQEPENVSANEPSFSDHVDAPRELFKSQKSKNDRPSLFRSTFEAAQRTSDAGMSQKNSSNNNRSKNTVIQDSQVEKHSNAGNADSMWMQHVDNGVFEKKTFFKSKNKTRKNEFLAAISYNKSDITPNVDMCPENDIQHQDTSAHDVLTENDVISKPVELVDDGESIKLGYGNLSLTSMASETLNYEKFKQLASSTVIGGDFSPKTPALKKNMRRLSKILSPVQDETNGETSIEQIEVEQESDHVNKQKSSVENIVDFISNNVKNPQETSKISSEGNENKLLRDVIDEIPRQAQNQTEEDDIFNNLQFEKIRTPKISMIQMKNISLIEGKSTDSSSIHLNQSEIDRAVIEEMKAKRTNPPVRRSTVIIPQTQDSIDETDLENSSYKHVPLRHSNVPILSNIVSIENKKKMILANNELFNVDVQDVPSVYSEPNIDSKKDDVNSDDKLESPMKNNTLPKQDLQNITKDKNIENIENRDIIVDEIVDSQNAIVKQKSDSKMTEVIVPEGELNEILMQNKTLESDSDGIIKDTEVRIIEEEPVIHDKTPDVDIQNKTIQSDSDTNNVMEIINVEELHLSLKDKNLSHEILQEKTLNSEHKEKDKVIYEKIVDQTKVQNIIVQSELDKSSEKVTTSGEKEKSNKSLTQNNKSQSDYHNTNKDINMGLVEENDLINDKINNEVNVLKNNEIHVIDVQEDIVESEPRTENSPKEILNSVEKPEISIKNNKTQHELSQQNSRILNKSTVESDKLVHSVILQNITDNDPKQVDVNVQDKVIQSDSRINNLPIEILNIEEEPELSVKHSKTQNEMLQVSHISNKSTTKSNESVLSVNPQNSTNAIPKDVVVENVHDNIVNIENIAENCLLTKEISIAKENSSESDEDSIQLQLEDEIQSFGNEQIFDIKESNKNSTKMSTNASEANIDLSITSREPITQTSEMNSVNNVFAKNLQKISEISSINTVNRNDLSVDSSGIISVSNLASANSTPLANRTTNISSRKASLRDTCYTPSDGSSLFYSSVVQKRTLDSNLVPMETLTGDSIADDIDASGKENERIEDCDNGQLELSTNTKNQKEKSALDKRIAKCLEELKEQNEKHNREFDEKFEKMFEKDQRPNYNPPRASNPWSILKEKGKNINKVFNLKPLLSKVQKNRPNTKQNIIKKPRLYMKERWITKRLYDFIQKEFNPIYGLEARAKSEEFIINLANTVKVVLKEKNNYHCHVSKLKTEMAQLKLIETNYDFHRFIEQYLPFHFRLRAIPAYGRDVPDIEGGLYDSIKVGE